ncbi:hypothetical protein NHX12_014284 [Muraenolepis orangiensis]|uniref:Ig-like domain-containing protein n=1 Tax=Muraenolepis orangiensis TaxID=630683 RepID=A0A9Q0I523_9TELE|nr:hypothetical protein NHX12_014284 [Muraenolepis orangiensis]
MALVGDDVTLSYDTKQLKDISEETVMWSRTDLKPDLVHLHDDRQTFYKLQNPAYRGRTVLSEEDLERGIISLRLSRVRLADEGNYTCLFSPVHNQYTVQLLVGEAHSVMALVGDDVTLSYDTKQLKNISEETVEWSRTDLKPDLVHLHDDRQTFYKLQNPAYRGRTVLSEEDLERGIISLRLSRVRLADEGNYTCLFPSVHNQYTVQLLVGEAHSVMALVGDDVTLSYDTKQLTDISEETVEWSRTDLKSDLVHLHEDHRTFNKLQNPAYRGRTVLSEEDLERGIISLRLSRVRLADEGNYTCLFSSVHNQYTVQLLVGMSEAGVFPSKVHPALSLEQLCGICSVENAPRLYGSELHFFTTTPVHRSRACSP